MPPTNQQRGWVDNPVARWRFCPFGYCKLRLPGQLRLAIQNRGENHAICRKGQSGPFHPGSHGGRSVCVDACRGRGDSHRVRNLSKAAKQMSESAVA
jgi:hypothetical protein